MQRSDLSKLPVDFAVILDEGGPIGTAAVKAHTITDLKLLSARLLMPELNLKRV